MQRRGFTLYQKSNHLSAGKIFGTGFTPYQKSDRRIFGTGFTLIELLVVLAIVALILASTMVVYSGVLTKNRDVRRLSDIREIQKSLALYFIDTRTYPVSSTPVALTGNDPVSVAIQNSGAISKVPSDPSPAYSYTYQSDTNGGNYTLTFCLEGSSIPNFSAGCNNSVSP